MSVETITEPFAAMLRRLRTEAGYTLRDLAQEARIPHSAIAAIESGHRSITLDLAERLADALGIKDKDSFLMKAVSTTKRQRILPFAKEYRAEILNALAVHLAYAGIFPGDIAGCYFAGAPFNESDMDGRFVTTLMDQTMKGNVRRSRIADQRGALPGPGLVIEMKSGRRYAVVVEVRAL